MSAHRFALIAIAFGCTQTVVPGGPCPPWKCANSPEVLFQNMHELHLGGEENAQLVTLEAMPNDADRRAAIFIGNKPHLLELDKGRILARSGNIVVEGQALVGAELHLLRKGGVLAYVRIERVSNYLVFDIGNPDPIETYKMSWYGPEGRGANICMAPIPAAQADAHTADLYGMKPDETLLFNGDRIDPKRMTIDFESSWQWVNFGCAGYTLAKLYLTRSTSLSSFDGVPEPEHNKAMLKMLVGDYCGKGEVITVSGTPIRWKSNRVDYEPSTQDLEARWGKHGAICLGKMRLEARKSPLFPNPRAQITCELPACEGTLDDLQDALLVSANPPYPPS